MFSREEEVIFHFSFVIFHLSFGTSSSSEMRNGKWEPLLTTGV
jgi:hypothetical protein